VGWTLVEVKPFVYRRYNSLGCFRRLYFDSGKSMSKAIF